MNKSLKRTASWISVIIVSVLCARIVLWLMFGYSHLWKLTADFETYAEDFILVKDYIAGEFSGETDKTVFVSYSEGQGIGLLDRDTYEYLELPSDVRASLKAIDKDGFPHKDANFDAIKIHEGRISFCVSGTYALVYSPNQKPSWLNSPDEDCKIKVKSIGDGWYHIVENPG